MLSFRDLATCFDVLESTSSRRDLVDHLADLLGRADADEVGRVAYLLQGRVAPFYEPTEFGLGEKSVASAIGRAYDVDPAEVLKRFHGVGDLGTAAQSLAGAAAAPMPGPSVAAIFDALRHIAEITGRGSVEVKVGMLADLLRTVDPVGAKHLIRVPLGTGRLGVGDVTVMAALAQAKLGDARRKSDLETAYNRVSDLGLIAETLWRDGLEAVQRLDVSVGRPIRPQLAERLPDAETIVQKLGGRVHAQWKFDGLRVQVHLDRGRADGHRVRLFSRNLEDLTEMFPEVAAAVRVQVRAETAILDAEALAYNPASDEFLPFQETMKRRRKHKVKEMQAALPLRAMVFDAMYRNGQPLLERPLLERLDALMEMVGGETVLKAERGQVVDDAARLRDLFEQALDRGLEGLVVKRLDSTYQAGARNYNWVKLKKHSGGALQDTIDCVLLGYLFGRGKRADLGVGALLVGVYDADADQFVSVSKIGTGLSDALWRDLRAKSEPYRRETRPARVNTILEPNVWLEPMMVIEVLADEITRSPIHTAGKIGDEPGYALRFPRFVRLREGDKRPEDATTVRELIELYDTQRAG